MLRYKEAEKWVLRKMLRELDDSLCYHDVKHTVDVIRAAERLAYLERLNDHDTILVRTAALFHDLGFCEQYMDNEPIAVEMAQQELKEYGYSEDDIDKVAGMITATKIPHEPKSHMEEIICDADLDYLGRDDFHPISENLRREFMHHKIVGSAKEWDQVQVKFFNQHRYFTASANRMRANLKARNLEAIESRLNSYD